MVEDNGLIEDLMKKYFIPNHINSTHVVLIPKIPNPKSIT